MKTVEERLDTFLNKPAAWAGWLAAMLLLLPHTEYLGYLGAYVAGPVTVGLHLTGWAALIGTAMALYQNHAQWQARIAAILSVSVAALLAAMVVGVSTRAMIWTDPAYMILLAAAFTTAGVGLWRGLWWSRWLSKGLAMAGLLAFTLNGMALPFLNTWMGWMCMALAASSMLMLINVSGSAMAERFEQHARAPRLWRRSDVAVRWLRHAMVLNTMALPMLLVFAWEQPAIQNLPWIQAFAVLCAIGLGLGLLFAAQGALVGLGVMVASGTAAVGMLALVGTLSGAFNSACHTGGVLASSVSVDLLLYYAAFWLPATISAVIALGQLLPNLVERVAPTNTSPFSDD